MAILPKFLLAGGFGFPVRLPLSLYLRKRIRRRFAAISESRPLA